MDHPLMKTVSLCNESNESNESNETGDNTIPLILPLQTNIDKNKSKKKNEYNNKYEYKSAITTSKSAPKLKAKSVFDSSLNAHRNKTVSLSAFSHLFCALVQYSQIGVKNVSELEDRLSNIGYNVGYKQLELMTYRVSNGRRHRDVIGMLEFIKDRVWKHLFGRTADGLEQSTSNKNEFFIIDHNPITNRYVSVPDHLGDFNAASFIAGIIHGILDGSGFPCTIIAHQQLPSKQQPKKRTVFIVQIKPKKKYGAQIK
eukprot:317028_1